MSKTYRQINEQMEKVEVKALITLNEMYPGMTYPMGDMASNPYIHPKTLAKHGGIHKDEYSHKVGKDIDFYDGMGNYHSGMVHRVDGNEVHLKDYNSGKVHKFTQYDPDPNKRIHVKADGKIYHGDNEMSKKDLERHVNLKRNLSTLKDINEETIEEAKWLHYDKKKFTPDYEDAWEGPKAEAEEHAKTLKHHGARAVQTEGGWSVKANPMREEVELDEADKSELIKAKATLKMSPELRKFSGMSSDQAKAILKKHGVKEEVEQVDEKKWIQGAVHPSREGMFHDRSLQSIEKEKEKIKGKAGNKVRMSQLLFAIRAKKHGGLEEN